MAATFVRETDFRPRTRAPGEIRGVAPPEDEDAYSRLFFNVEIPFSVRYWYSDSSISFVRQALDGWGLSRED